MTVRAQPVPFHEQVPTGDGWRTVAGATTTKKKLKRPSQSTNPPNHIDGLWELFLPCFVLCTKLAHVEGYAIKQWFSLTLEWFWAAYGIFWFFSFLCFWWAKTLFYCSELQRKIPLQWKCTSSAKSSLQSAVMHAFRRGFFCNWFFFCKINRVGLEEKAIKNSTERNFDLWNFFEVWTFFSAGCLTWQRLERNRNFKISNSSFFDCCKVGSEIRIRER